MELGISVAARMVLKGRAEDVAGHHLRPAPSAAGIGAVRAGDVLERPAHRVVVAGFNLPSQPRRGNGPKGADALVGAEGDVYSRGATLAVRVACKGAQIVRRESGVEGLELLGPNDFAVVEAEESGGIPPASVRLVAGVVVVKRGPVTRHVAEVVGGRGGLGDGLHDRRSGNDRGERGLRAEAPGDGWPRGRRSTATRCRDHPPGGSGYRWRRTGRARTRAEGVGEGRA